MRSLLSPRPLPSASSCFSAPTFRFRVPALLFPSLSSEIILRFVRKEGSRSRSIPLGQDHIGLASASLWLFKRCFCVLISVRPKLDVPQLLQNILDFWTCSLVYCFAELTLPRNCALDIPWRNETSTIRVSVNGTSVDS